MRYKSYEEYKADCLAKAFAIYVREDNKTVALASLTSKEQELWIKRWWHEGRRAGRTEETDALPE